MRSGRTPHRARLVAAHLDPGRSAKVTAHVSRRRPRSAAVVLGGLGAALSGPAVAAPTAELASTSSVVTIRGRAREDVSAAETVLERPAIERARARGDGLATLVERAPGAVVSDEGGPLRARRPRLRGGSAAQVLVLVDDVAIASPFATGADLSLLGLASVGRVVVQRGGAGAALGDGALAGAVRVSSDPSPPRWRVALRGGALDTQGIELGARAGAWSFAAEADRTGGRFDYVSRLAGLPDDARTRENNDAQRVLLSIRAGGALGPGTLEGGAQLALREAGVAGLETQSSLTAREARLQALGRMTWRCARGCGWPLDASLVASALDVAYDELGGSLASSSTRFVVAGGELGVTPRLGAHRLTLRASGSVERARATPGADATRGRVALVALDTWRGDGWALTGGLRGSLVAPGTLALLPRLGLEVWPTTALALVVGAGRSLRAPTIDELYHPAENGLVGNPGLVPETAWDVDARARLWALDALRAEVGAFARRVEDTLVYVNRNAFVVRPENLGPSRAVGLEAELGLDLAWSGVVALDASAALGLTWTALDVGEAPLPGAPVAALDAGLAARPALGAAITRALGGPWPLELFTRLHATTAATANASGTIEVRPYHRWDVGLSLALPDGLGLALQLQNLLDVRTLETLHKIPLPGRTWTAVLRWTPEVR
jgi:outer membrane receptor protein involved in Fe transport